MNQSSKTRELGSIVSDHFPDLEVFSKIYKDIHENPELGTHEVRTAAIASAHLKDLDFKVTKNIGGHGVVGVLSNGPGSTVLLRADMDALSIRENTQLPYASTKIFKDKDGKKTPIMHACGHDMNVTNLMATAELLTHTKSK